MSIDTNKDLVRAFEAHINARELDEAIALLSPDFVDHTPGVGLPSGIDGVRAFFTMQYTGLPDNHRRSMEMIGEGDKVVHRLSGEGTHEGMLLGMPPTGRRVTWSCIDIWRVEDGRLVEHWVEADMLGLMQQIGLVPPPRPIP